jgi:phage baseplate assembly protein W
MANIPFETELYQTQLTDPHAWTANPAIPKEIQGYAPPPVLQQFGCRWKGAAVPTAPRKDGRLGVKCTNELVKASILMIYTTRVGGRLMQPLFGSHFLDILFEPNDAVLRAEIVVYMTDAIRTWEPRINLLSINVFSSGSDVAIHHNYTIIESGLPVDLYLQAQKAAVGSLRIVSNVG